MTMLGIYVMDVGKFVSISYEDMGNLKFAKGILKSYSKDKHLHVVNIRNGKGWIIPEKDIKSYSSRALRKEEERNE